MQSVTLSIGGSDNSLTISPNGKYTFTPPTALSDGVHTASVTARDRAGNSATQTLTFSIDTESPTISITSPTENSFVDDTTPTITFTVNEANQHNVTLTLNGTNNTLQIESSGVYSFTPSSALSDGPHTISVTVYDKVENSVTQTRTFSIDSVSPIITIISPTENSLLQDNTPTITFNVTETKI